MSSGLYEQIGRGYAQVRHPDPRISAIVEGALGDAESVVNVGAGPGSYEAAGRRVLAVEPAAEMRAQRPARAAECIPGTAERLPVPDASFDVAMSIYSDFHWEDRRRGIQEMCRVSRRRVVILTVEREASARYWLFRDYLPEANELFAPLDSLISLFPHPPRVAAVPIPSDCSDGFVHAFWKRPDMLLDPAVHGTMAVFSQLAPDITAGGLDQLQADLNNGAWLKRNSELLGIDSLDLGHRMVIWDHPTDNEG